MNIIKYLVDMRNRHLVSAQAKEIRSILKYGDILSEKDMYCRLKEFLGKGSFDKKILEIGCGPGKYVAMIEKLGHHVIGADPHRFENWKEIKNDNIEFVDNVYGENLPFQDNEFDNSVCLGTLLYFNSPKKALEEIKRVTKKDASIIIRTVNRKNYYTLKTGMKLDPASKNLYSMEELIKLLNDSNFKVEEFYSWGYWPPIMTNQWWWFMNVVLSNNILNFISNLTPAENRINLIVKVKNLK